MRQSQAAGDFARDLFLNFVYRRRRPLVLVAPDLAVVADVGQFDADQEIAVLQQHPSGQNRFYIQLLADRLGVDLFALVSDDRLRGLTVTERTRETRLITLSLMPSLR